MTPTTSEPTNQLDQAAKTGSAHSAASESVQFMILILPIDNGVRKYMAVDAVLIITYVIIINIHTVGRERERERERE
jgi:hypothetical protein